MKKSIHALKVQYPTYGPDGILEPHRKWMLSYMIRDNFPYDARKIMALGYGGVLYPPGACDEEVFNEKVMSVCGRHMVFCYGIEKRNITLVCVGKKCVVLCGRFFLSIFSYFSVT